MLSSAASLRDHAAFFQSETMRPANDPKERDPSHVRMLNDVLRDLEKSFIIPQTPPGVYSYLTDSTPKSVKSQPGQVRTRYQGDRQTVTTVLTRMVSIIRVAKNRGLYCLTSSPSS
ncbi:unnamed protein product [Pleuronectes platessa]|uniref:Uncharacterized protein n=1 Tax=Pleuronectes platessa TaxID=8262 RepID=A0A9N7VN69_PLEPL|nr:unnamed protein product [Pleuronectes platessa]